MTDRDRSTIPQGSLALLDAALARTLLTSTIPARLAFTASDGTPRLIPTWFQWADGQVVMPTFISAPHVSSPTRRIAALSARPAVAISIDTEGNPAQALLIRGHATVTEIDGIDPDYANSARRYLGDEAASGYLAMVDRPGTRMARIAVRPAWVGLLDFGSGRLPAAMTPPA